MALSYKDSGVDLDSYAEAMGRLPDLMKQTHTPRVMPLTGGFAGLFQLQGDDRKYIDPVLVSGTDGVGTKIKVAIAANRFDTIGIDLVAMCVNDCLCLGAEPLFFLDYLALPKDDPDLVADLVAGVSEGCSQAGAALIGGETAIMPDLYAAGDFDMAGFCVGVVERDKIIDGSRIKSGDVLFGIESSGLHSNGFSLVRKIVFEAAGLSVDDTVAELRSTVGEAILTPTRIYAKFLADVHHEEQLGGSVAGIAHITGGGLAENIGRIMPENCTAVVDRSTLTVPVVFDWLQRLGDVDREEMFRVFNMGTGLVLVIPEDSVEAASRIAAAHQLRGGVIGQIVAGESGGRYKN